MTNGDDARYVAQFSSSFWRSPFALAAAATLAAQIVLMLAGFAAGRPLDYDTSVVLTALCALLLTAGIWPGWNYLRVDEQGLDQQAGLRSLKVSWADVQNVRAFDGWAELRVVVDRKRVRCVRVFDRYGLGPEDFAELIETRWERARRRVA